MTKPKRKSRRAISVLQRIDRSLGRRWSERIRNTAIADDYHIGWHNGIRHAQLVVRSYISKCAR